MIKSYVKKLAAALISVFGFSLVLWLMVSFVNWELWIIPMNEVYQTARTLVVMAIVYAGIWQYLNSED
jgi:hypothetical protein